MSNLMPASEKLRERALRIIMSLGALEREEAVDLLRRCDGDVANATRLAREGDSSR